MAAALSYTDARFPPNVALRTVDTPYARIATFISTPPSSTSSPSATTPAPPTLLLIHGNSASSLIFRNVFASPLAQTHRLVALDLPGHGESGDAAAPLGPDRVYTMTAYARAALAALRATCGACDAVVMGWSLGGHVGIEMCDLLAAERKGADGAAAPGPPRIRIRALLLTGTPPVPRGNVDPGFYTSDPHMAAIVKAAMTPAELDALAGNMVRTGHEGWMRDAAARTDGAARAVMFAAFRDGRGAGEQRACVERLTCAGSAGADPAGGDGQTGEDGSGEDTVVAVVNGATEPFIDIAYIREQVRWGPGLWRGRCFEIGGAEGGHTPFWEVWEEYWPLLRDLMADVGGGGGGGE